VGGQLIDPPGDKEPVIKFEDFNKALWAMAFAASGLGQAAMCVRAKGMRCSTTSFF
jgi:hypothetical protein